MDSALGVLLVVAAGAGLLVLALRALTHERALGASRRGDHARIRA
jgi:hypothetical protein